jgi:aquaporin Z
MQKNAKYLAEFIGTFFLVFGGVGAAVLAGDRLGPLGISLAFGLSLLAMAYAIGPISGCHINPAVSVGLFAMRKMGVKDLAGYVVAQCLGAVAAAGLVLLIAEGAAGGYDLGVRGLAANGYGEHSPAGFGLGAAFLAETLLTFFFIFTILGATDVRIAPGFAGIPIGLCLTLVHLVGLPITNTSVNPARSLGSAFYVGGWALEQVWMFLLAPLAGSLLAAAVYHVIGRRVPVERREADRRGHPAEIASVPVAPAGSRT